MSEQTLRDIFAGNALVSILSSASTSDAGNTHYPDAIQVAIACYVYADALMQQRDKNESKS